MTLANTTAKYPQILQPETIVSTELMFVVLWVAALCVVTSLPYAIGSLMHVPGTVFSNVLNHSADVNNYLAYAHQAAEGKWLFHNPMTGEPHREVFFDFEWLVIGKMSSLLHVSLTSAMNIQRLLSILLMCYGVYWLSAYLLHSILVRRIALVAITAGGGFGWFAAIHLLHIRLDSSYFLDLTAALQFPFYWALKLPHFLVSETFVVLGLCFFLAAERTFRMWGYVCAGLCYMLAGTCRPYDMLYLMVATALFLVVGLWRNKRMDREILLRSLPILMCVPLLGYYYWIFKLHPIFRWWSFPGGPPPAPWILALSYGMSFIFLVLAIWRLRNRPLEPPAMFMTCCLVAAIVLTYLHFLFHFSFQFATNIVMPLVMISLVSFEKSIEQWVENSRRWAQGSIVALLLVNSFTSIALTGQAVVLVRSGDFRNDTQVLEAYSWLNDHSRPDDLVLADFDNSNQIPQYAHDNVFCGYINTVRIHEKLKELDAFFQANTSTNFREWLIQQNAIHFVVLTAAEEKGIGRPSYLREVFRNNAVTVFSAITNKQRDR